MFGLHITDETQLLTLKEVVHLDFLFDSLEIVNEAVVSLLLRSQPDISVAILVLILKFNVPFVIIGDLDQVLSVRLIMIVIQYLVSLIWPVLFHFIR